MKSVSLLIPAYNEHAAIRSTVERSLKVLKECTTDYELIVLDDASTDDTFTILQQLKQEHPEIRIERHTVNSGIAATFEDLYRMATKDFVFLISGDGQFPPESLKQCMPLLDDYDIVVCNRVRKEYTFYRHLISSSYRRLPQILFGIDLYDSGSIKCVRREVFTTVPVTSKSVFVEAERIIRAVKRGYRMTKVDIVQEPRKGGKARGGRVSTVAKAAGDLLRVWWELQILKRKP